MKEEVVFKDDKVGESSFIVKMIVQDSSEKIVARGIISAAVARVISNRYNKDFKGKTLEEIYCSLKLNNGDKNRIQGPGLGSMVG